VKNAAGSVIANTRTGLGKKIMTAAGVFKPKAAGTYTITAECYRTRKAKVLRSASEAVTVTVK